jgi:hypothetical protein
MVSHGICELAAQRKTAMSLQALTYFFGWYQQGWSETWFGNFAGLAKGIDSLRRVAVSRDGLLGKQAYIKGWRARLLDGSRQSVIETNFSTDFGNPSGELAADTPYAGWYVQLTSTGGARQMFTRGQPDVWYSDRAGNQGLTESPPAPTAGFTAAMQTFFDSIQNEVWGVETLDQTIPKHLILNVTADPVTGGFFLALPPAVTAPAGSRISIYGSASVPTLRGRHRVMSAPVTPVNGLVLFTPAPALIQYRGDATFRLNSFVFSPFLSFHPRRMGKRATGRPFFLTAGRRRKVKLVR